MIYRLVKKIFLECAQSIEKENPDFFEKLKKHRHTGCDIRQLHTKPMQASNCVILSAMRAMKVLKTTVCINMRKKKNGMR